MWYRTHGNIVGMAGPWLLIGTAIMWLGIWQQVATATHPPAPRPCEAEGVCRPSRATWGWNQTRWRPWPGDQAGLQPSATATPATEQDEEPFKMFERPTPEEEDQREKMPKKADRDGSAAPMDEAAPMNESIPDLPAVELEGRVTPQPIPVIDEVALQLPAARGVELWQSAEASPSLHDASGEPHRASQIASSSQPVLAGVYKQARANIPQPLPETDPEEPRTSATEHRGNSAAAIPADRQQDDMPPSLPASLRRMATGFRSSANTTTPKRQPRLNSRLARLPQPPAGGVVPVTWKQSTDIQSTGIRSTGIRSTGIASMGIGLINPAAAVSASSDEDELKQAIYYEATE